MRGRFPLLLLTCSLCAPGKSMTLDMCHQRIGHGECLYSGLSNLISLHHAGHTSFTHTLVTTLSQLLIASIKFSDFKPVKFSVH